MLCGAQGFFGTDLGPAGAGGEDGGHQADLQSTVSARAALFASVLCPELLGELQLSSGFGGQSKFGSHWSLWLLPAL